MEEKMKEIGRLLDEIKEHDPTCRFITAITVKGKQMVGAHGSAQGIAILLAATIGENPILENVFEMALDGFKNVLKQKQE